jgi:hypothetical protein
VKVKANGFVNDIVDSLGIVVDIFLAASEFVSATNIDGSSRVLRANAQAKA